MRGCPPFADVFQVKFFGVFENEVAEGALRFRQALTQALRDPAFAATRVTVMGPAPASVVRVMNRYHYQLTLLARNSRPLRDLLCLLYTSISARGLGKVLVKTVKGQTKKGRTALVLEKFL